MERLRLGLAEKVDELFARGILIHVTDVQYLENILLRRGLLSPCLRAQHEGKVIPEGTVWHPQDNLFVKFLRLPGSGPDKNIRILRSHFWEFGHPDLGQPIGLIVDNNQAIKLFEDSDEEDEDDLDSWPYHDSHFYGIRDSVPPQDILGIIIFMGGVARNPKETLYRLTTNPFLITVSAALTIVSEAGVKLGRQIRIFDDTGREIL